MNFDIGLRKRFWAEIDMDAARENFLHIRSRLNSETRLCCVVKANAYGHGALYLSRLYEELGADTFAVSNIEEAMQLRKGGIKGDILILGYTPAECAEYLLEYRLIQTVYSYEYAQSLSKCVLENDANARLTVHIKLDTGMGRLGFRCRNEAELNEVVAASRLGGLYAEGVFTHFALADGGESGTEYTDGQYKAFKNAVSALEERGVHFDVKHCSNSAALLDFNGYGMNMVRAGIVLYGLVPSSDIRAEHTLKPVMSLRAIVSLVKEIDKGDALSYGCTFVADKKMKIATVPVGYADGYLRANGKNKMYMLVRGKRAPIVGRICMDQLMLDVTDIDGVCMGDTVTVIGRDGEEEISAYSLAERNGTIPYEILCGVGERVPRMYMSHGKPVRIKDNIISDI